MTKLRRTGSALCAAVGLACLVLGGWSAAQFRVATADTASAAGRAGGERPAPLAWLGPEPFVPLIALLFAAPTGFVGFIALGRGPRTGSGDAE